MPSNSYNLVLKITFNFFLKCDPTPECFNYTFINWMLLNLQLNKAGFPSKIVNFLFWCHPLRCHQVWPAPLAHWLLIMLFFKVQISYFINSRDFDLLKYTSILQVTCCFKILTVHIADLKVVHVSMANKDCNADFEQPHFISS